MYEMLDAISSEQVADLKALMDTVTFRDDDGHNEYNLETSKWLEWTREQRETFKSLLPSEYVDKALIGHFLNIAEESGYLGEQTAWVDAHIAGTMYSYALTDNSIIIDGRTVEVAEGEGIKFSLKEIHEIRKSSSGQKWACLMLMI